MSKTGAAAAKRYAIICGYPRSGTRMIANILNRHPRAAVGPEVAGRIIQASMGVFEEYENYCGAAKRKESRYQLWRAQRAPLMEKIWLAAAPQSVRKKAAESLVVANKTPRAERFFDFYERVFDEPLWIYCMRDPYLVIRSLKNMPWNDQTVGERADDWVDSVRTYQRMISQRPGKTLLVRIDQHSVEDAARLIWTHAGLEFDDDLVARAAALPVAQPASSVVKKVVDLTDAERAVLNGNRMLQKLRAEMGYA